MRGQARSVLPSNRGVMKYTLTVKRRLQKNSIQDSRHRNTDDTIVIIYIHIFLYLKKLISWSGIPPDWSSPFYEQPLLTLSGSIWAQWADRTAQKIHTKDSIKYEIATSVSRGSKPLPFPTEIGYLEDLHLQSESSFSSPPGFSEKRSGSDVTYHFDR